MKSLQRAPVPKSRRLFNQFYYVGAKKQVVPVCPEFWGAVPS